MYTPIVPVVDGCVFLRCTTWNFIKFRLCRSRSINAVNSSYGWLYFLSFVEKENSFESLQHLNTLGIVCVNSAAKLMWIRPAAPSLHTLFTKHNTINTGTHEQKCDNFLLYINRLVLSRTGVKLVVSVSGGYCHHFLELLLIFFKRKNTFHAI